MSDTAPLDQVAEQRVDEICDRFEAGWRNGTHDFSLEDALNGVTGPERAILFRELMRVELELRRSLQERPALTDYLSRFPEFAELLGELLGAPAGQGLVLGEYEVLSELGRGGMGVVYLARQRHPARLVALKVIRADQLAGLPPDDRRRWLERFRIEVEAAGRLEHEHVIPIYDAGERDGQPFFAMRYVAGHSLHELTREGPLPGATAAAYLESVACAVHFAHQLQVLHRDLKPQNILIETTTSRPFVMDFGLAKVVEGGTTVTGTRELIGTPGYMAPEQIGAPGHVGPATDIYGLGATLYQLLTGRPPFQAGNVAATLQQVARDEPVPPRRLNPAIDRALETITLKCLAKEPERRYVSAAALAEDLRRYRAGEAILAQPAGWLERCRLWCRRNPARAFLAASLVLSLLALLGAGIWGYLSQAAALQEGQAREQAQAAAIREAEARQQDQHLLAIVQSNTRDGGWSEKAWALVRKAAAVRGYDERLRDLAALSLAGLDARKLKGLDALAASSATTLVFDLAGDRLLMSGTEDRKGKPVAGAQLWDTRTGKLQVSDRRGAGPVAFRGGNQGPVQLVEGQDGSLIVYDPIRRQKISTCRLSGASPLRGRDDRLGFVVAALAPDGSRVAAVLREATAEPIVAVWDAATGNQLFTAPLPPGTSASAVAFGPGGQLLAVATGGRVTLWSVPGGEELGSLATESVVVHCLAFSPDAVCLPGRKMRGRLAAGDAGGLATIWDLGSPRTLSVCRGGPYDIFALAFSPDGSLLATSGRGSARLFDVATGRFLLSLEAGDPITGLAFAANGRRLALASPNQSVGVQIWELLPGRGQLELHGLGRQVSLVRFSPDGRRLAALAQNWQVALWELPNGRLLNVLDVRHGWSPDNAALAFSADNRCFAFCAGEEASLWDVDSGRKLETWPLPQGLIDRLAFVSNQRLWLFRWEPLATSRAPGQSWPLPQVYRGWDLHPGKEPKEFFKLDEFNRRLFSAVISPNGSIVVVEGQHQGPDGDYRAIKAFAAPGGQELWSRRSLRSAASGSLGGDAGGGLVTIQPEKTADHTHLVQLATGADVEVVTTTFAALGPGAMLRVYSRNQQPGPAYALVRRGAKRPLVGLGQQALESFTVAFSRDGRQLAWGSSHGTVTVADLEEFRRRLAEVGLGW
jgi:serine/threonine protein kinase/WD40 repeat protein